MEAGRGDADGGLCRRATRQLGMMGLLHANCQCFSRPRHVWPARTVPLPGRVVFTTDHRTSIGLPGGIPKGYLPGRWIPRGEVSSGHRGRASRVAESAPPTHHEAEADATATRRALLREGLLSG